MNEPENCLGISLGTRFIGLAVGNRKELLHWQVKDFPGTYTKTKGKKMIRAIDRWIKRYHPTFIALKIPKNGTRSSDVHHIIKQFEHHAMTVELPICFYDIEVIEDALLSPGSKSKKLLAEVLSEKYPELKREFFKLPYSDYYNRIFEAVAALELRIEEQHSGK